MNYTLTLFVPHYYEEEQQLTKNFSIRYNLIKASTNSA